MWRAEKRKEKKEEKKKKKDKETAAGVLDPDETQLDGPVEIAEEEDEVQEVCDALNLLSLSRLCNCFFCSPGFAWAFHKSTFVVAFE